MNSNNADEIAQKLNEFIELTLKQSMKAGIDGICNFVEAEAKKNTKIDTGRLRGSIESKSNVSGNSVQGCVYTNVEYAHYHHEGTGIYARKGGRSTTWVYEENGEFIKTNGQKPNPFLEDAVLDNTTKIKNAMVNGVKNKL